MRSPASSGEARGKWQMSSVVVFSDLQTAGVPCSNPRGSRFFPTFYGTFATHVTNAGLFHFLGRIELDPGYTCKPRRPAALHSYTWLPATQTGPVSQQRGSRSGSMTSHGHYRYEELMAGYFCDDMRCCSVTCALLSS